MARFQVARAARRPAAMPLPHQKGVVADGLDLQIIVKPGASRLQLVPRRITRQHGAEQLARLA